MPSCRLTIGIVVAAITLLNGCQVAPAPRGATLSAQAGGQARGGPPALPGIDGPFGVTQIGAPGQPWSTGAPEVVTTAELMARRGRMVVRDRTAPTGIAKIRPDRTGLADNPDAPAVAQWPPSPRFRHGGPAASFVAATPNVNIGVFADTGGATPPDTMGDVGPTQYVLAMNGRVRAVSKATGAVDPAFDLDSDVFYGAAAQNSPTGDPRVRYDRRAGRWYILMFNIAVPNRYLLAVSSSSTITASTTWTIRFWANTRTQGGAGAVPCLGDYPTLGVDEDALYVGVNQFCGANLSTLTFDSTSVYVLNRASVLSTGSVTISQFDGVIPNSSSGGPYTPQGVDNFDAGTDEGYIIGVDALAFSTLMLRRISNPAGVPTLSGNLPLTVPTTTFPVNVPQPGTAASLDGIDDRLMNAVIRNGTLWTVHQIGVNTIGVGATGSSARTAERWYQIGNLAGTPTLIQSGTVFDSAAINPTHHWMGSIMVNGQGHVALGASRGGAATFVNTEFTGRLAGAAAGTMETPTQYSSNTATSFTLQGTAGQRWGDYSYTSVDPDDDMTMWTLQEYPNASNSYAVRLIRLQAPPPAAIDTVSPSTIAAGQSAVTVTVTGLSTGGSGFFDPGPGFARRIAASVSGGGVGVTGVTVTSPTSLTLTIDTMGAAAGARTLTVTNPDGQATALAGAITIAAAPITNADSYTTPFNTPLVVAAPGVLANDVANGSGLTAVRLSDPANGVVSLNADGSFTYTPAPSFVGSDSFTYRAERPGAVGNAASVTVAVTAPTGPVAPANLRVRRVLGNAVTMSWTAPPGPAPTSFLLEGGVAPGQTLGTLPLGVTTAVTVSLPSGSFYLRLRTVAGAQVSGPSSEVLAHVNVPVTPSAPVNLLGTVSGSTLQLAWTPTYGGGEPTGAVLDVSGALAASLPLGPVDAFSYPAVPPGTYTFRVRQTNGGGSSVASSPLTLTFAGPCTGAPLAPANLLAYKSGGVLFLAWDPPASGAAPSSYAIHVTGSYTGSLPMGGARSFSVPGPPGTYTLTVTASNVCGTSAPTAPQTVSFP